jgi:hypothetical protein
MKSNLHRQCTALVMLGAFSSQVLAAEGGNKYSNAQTPPPNIPVRSSAQFFPSDPQAKLVMPVNIWGEVREPGVHFVLVDSSLLKSISSAGGPTGTADIDSVTLIRNGTHKNYSLKDDAVHRVTLQKDDTLYVERSIKSDLPLIFGAVSTIVSVVTLYFVSKKK